MAIASKKIQKLFPCLSYPGKVHADDTNHDGFDLAWNDELLFPDVLYPDAKFLLNRMNEAAIECVNPRAGELIADIGCGRGIEGVKLAAKGAVVIGIEPSKTMLSHARDHIRRSKDGMSLVRGIGEDLPFRYGTVDKVLCKGALDHFPDPQQVIRQMAVALKPEGKVIIAVANFGSLGFKMGRFIWWIRKHLGFELPECRMLWEVPEDHTCQLDYTVLKRMATDCLEIERISGVSMLFGLPWWGLLLARLPESISLGILKSLDIVARFLPRLSDVVVMICKPKGNLGNAGTGF